MNDLTDLMYEASDGDPNRALDPATMVRQGRRRRHRRQGIVAVGSVVAAALVIVGGATWLPGMTDDGGSRPGDAQPPVASDTGHSDEPPAAGDDASVRAACGRLAGQDFSDWEVVTADSKDGRLAALLRSADERIADCRLAGPQANDLESGLVSHVRIMTEAKLRSYTVGFGDYQVHPSFNVGCQREPPGRWVADCLGTGWVTGPEPAERIVITDVTGATHEIQVVDRMYAFAGTVINHADIPEGGCPPPPEVCDDEPGELHFTVYAADGTVLAEYDEDKDLPLIT